MSRPLDRRAGVQDRALPHVRQQIARDADADEQRLRVLEARQRLVVRARDRLRPRARAARAPPRCRARAGATRRARRGTSWRSSSSANRSTPALATASGRPRSAISGPRTGMSPVPGSPRLRASAAACALPRTTTAPAASSRARWSSSPCGSPSAPHERDDHVASSRAPRALDGRRELAGRVRVGAVAEHDVEQQHGHRSDAPCSASASIRSDGSIIGWARPGCTRRRRSR